jgi:hypothetical protein
MPRKKKLCGQLTRAGTPCQHSKKLDKDGRCKQHTKVIMAAIQADKKKALELLADPLKTLVVICDDLGRSIWTVLGWRVADPKFDAEWTSVREAIDEARTDIVEDNMFIRAASARANPAESIFWLKNRRKKRWKDKQEIEAYGKDGAPLMPVQAIRAMLDADDVGEG